MKKERLFLALLGLIVLMVVILSISLGWRPAFDMIRYTGAVTWNDNGSAVQDVNGCGTLSTANAVYTLNQSLSATSSCFSITAANITLDCQGFWINGSQIDGQRAIENLGYDNTTIRNCNIRDFGKNTEGCFLSGTEITMADGSYKNIEDIEVGDSVISYDEPTGKEIITQVKKKFIHDSSEFSRHYLIINNKLKVTPNHPLYVNGQWKEAGKINKGDYLLDEEGDQIPVNNLVEVSEDVPVYNIEVSGKTIDLCGPGHNYYADGMLAHNKPCAFLFSKEDDKTELEWHIFGVYDKTGNYDSALLDLRNIKEKQGYSYLNLIHETNKFELVELPYEIDFIDFLELKVVDTPVYPFNLILKEKIYHLKLVSASQGLELMQEPDEQYFNLTSTQRISITFEELPEKNTFYKRNLVFVAKGWYEFYEGATLLGDWLYEEPYKDEKMIKHFEQKNRRDEIVEIYRTTIEKMGGREGILPYPYEEDYTSSKQNSGNSGIHIENSNYHLIENVVIANSVLIYETGIYFKNVNFSTISNVSISNVGRDGECLGQETCPSAIKLATGSNYNLIENSNISNNGYGVVLDPDWAGSSSYNNLTSIVADSNTVGFWISTSYNTLINNTANNNVQNGIEMGGSHNILINNTANDNTPPSVWGGEAGIYVTGNNNTLINNTANSNCEQGIYVQDSNNTLINNTANLNGRDSYWGSGIYLTSSNNNLTGNTANLNNYSGIYVVNQQNNILINNIANSNNESGIYFYNSDDNVLTNNTANLNTDVGIYFASGSNSNNITNNTVSSNNYGIYLSSSIGNILRNTNMSNNSANFHIAGSSNSHFNHDIDSSNIIDYNKKIYYNYSTADYVFDLTTAPDAGMVLCAACDNVTIKDLNLSVRSFAGIYFFNTSNSRIENVSANSNDYGIYIYNSENNTLRNTNMSNNSANFHIAGSSNSHFNHDIDSSNIIDYNKKIYYNYSTADYVFDLTTAPDAGMVLCAGCDNITVKDLNLSAKNFAGAYFFNTTNSRIENVSVNSNNYGIYLHSSDNNNITNNTANLNNDGGIYLYNSHSNNITNSIVNSNIRGIYMYYSKNNRVIDLTSWNCSSGVNYAGIYIKRSSGNYFENIYLNYSSSSARGIHIFGDSSTASLNSSNNLFKDVVIENIAGNDVYIRRTAGEVLNNTFVNSTYSTSKEVVSGINTELIRKWHLDVVVSDSGGYLGDANVTGINVSDVELFSALTDVDGSIERQELIEYSNLNNAKAYATPHTINITKPRYATNLTTYNLTLEQNVNHLVTLVANETSPSDPPTTPSGGSSGTIILSQIEEGYSNLLRETQKMKFIINEEVHTVVINVVDNENKKVEIELEEIGEVIELSENETKKIDLNNDGYYDLEISVKEVVNNYADLEFKEIHEEIPAEEQEEQESPSKIEKEIKDWMWIVGCLIGLIVIGVVVRRMLVKNKRESTI